MEQQNKNEYDVQAAKMLGKELRQRREQQNISVAEVGERLKLAEEQIETLEEGNYAGFSALVFVTGFLRSYARLLKWSDADIAGRLKAVVPHAADHAYAVDRQKSGGFTYQNTEKNGFPKWILGLAALVLAAGAIYAWQSKSNQVHHQQNAQDSSAVQNSLKAPELKASNVVVSKMEHDGTQVIKASEASAVAASDVAASAASAPKVEVAADELWLKVQYRSNLIVTDKDGKMVFSRIIPAGSERRFRGGAPYEVWIGIAAGAQANFGGKAINPQSHRTAGEKSATFSAGK